MSLPDPYPLIDAMTNSAAFVLAFALGWLVAYALAEFRVAANSPFLRGG